LSDGDGRAGHRGWRCGRDATWLPFTAGLVLFAAGLGQSIAALDIHLAISRTLSAGDSLARSSGTPTAVKIEMAPGWAEAQDLFLLAWAKSRLISPVPSDANAAVLDSALRDAEKAVASAPGYGAGWLMLADLRRVAGAPASDVAKLLKISILTAPFEPHRVVTRLLIGFSAYPSLDDEGRELLASQIQMAWRHTPDALIKLVRTPDRVDRLFIVRLALSSDPVALADFEKLLGRLR
jgi:hypothetical protein